MRDPDPGWNYGTKVDGSKNSVRCNFCHSVSSGGITRHKHHLACDSPYVAKCTKVPAKVKNLFKEMFEKKKQAKEAMSKIPHFDDVVDLEEDEDEDEIELPSKSKGKRPASSIDATNTSNKKAKGPLYSVFKPSTITGMKGGHLVGSVKYKNAQKKIRLDAVQRFCRWMYDASIFYNALKYNNLGPAIDAIGQFGVGMKPPTYHEARVFDVEARERAYEKTYARNEAEKLTYGCSLMADEWRDRRGRSLINFQVNNPRSSVFIESVDASSYSHTDWAGKCYSSCDI
ncbi:uncharacterized protein LOC143622177 [Bidens hawaiensis]|uniref:uncharacterized protein LOC143622177 n=1 Tax=Bidens hawaiensis TaxID=980011 RepID=UPI0040490601